MEIRVIIPQGVMRLKCKNTSKQLAQCLAHNGSRYCYYYYMSYWYFDLISDNTQQSKLISICFSEPEMTALSWDYL